MVPGAVFFLLEKKMAAPVNLLPVHVSEIRFVPPLGHTTRCTGVRFVLSLGMTVDGKIRAERQPYTRTVAADWEKVVPTEDTWVTFKTFIARESASMPSSGSTMDGEKMNARTALFGRESRVKYATRSWGNFRLLPRGPRLCVRARILALRWMAHV